MSIISAIQGNGGLFRGGLIGALFGISGSCANSSCGPATSDGGGSCANGSCGPATSDGGGSCANGSCSGGSKGPSNEMLGLRPGGGCANGQCS